jgi:TRAP-type transport system periplasmic protein
MRYWKSRSLILCLSVIGLFFLSFSALTFSVFGQAKPIELNYSVVQPATHGNAVLAAQWSKEIEMRTNGKVKITLFYGGTLTPADKIYNGVVKGISDIGQSVLAYTRGKFPLMEAIDLPLGCKTGYAATKLVNEFYRKFKPKELDDVKVMYLHCIGPGILFTKAPVYKLEDLKGRKIRCTGLAAKVVTALGGTPVAMPIGDTYDAVSRGIVEGLMSPVEVLEGYRLGEVVKFVTENFGSAYSMVIFVVMNKDKWNSLPPDIQKTIEKINEEWIEKNGKSADDIDKSGKDFALKKGVQFISLSKEEDERWVKAVRPLLDDYVNSMKVKGLPGEEALKFCLNRLKQIQ